MNRMMIDFETLSLNHNALPLSIGVTVFNLDGIITEYYANIDCRTLARLYPNDFHIEFGTVAWWMQQSEEARNRIFSAGVQITEPTNVWGMLQSMWQNFSCQELWANGADFDGAVLKNLGKTFGYRPFWAYNALRDARTIYKLFPKVVAAVPKEGVAHDALADAKWQTKALVACLRIIEGSELPDAV